MSQATETPATLLQAVRHFAQPDIAFEYVRNLRWPDKVTCPLCGCEDHSFLQTRKMWQCKGCVQIEQDFALCEIAFPNMKAIPIAAQFAGDLIVLFDFELQDGLAKIGNEKHYRLVPQEDLTPEELETYRNRAEGE